MFEQVTAPLEDATEAMFLRLAHDERPHKLDLGIGIYRSEDGAIPLMECVRQAERRLTTGSVHKGYLNPLGNAAYCEQVLPLALGEHHELLRSGTIVSAQTPGAGGALRVAAEMVMEIHPGSTAWFTDPVWPHQMDFFRGAGMPIKQFRYYDIESATRLDDQAIEDLKQMKPGDLLVLHGSCHNPTGEDPDLNLWQRLTQVVLETGAIPLIDLAYQGFGDGVEEDVAGLRLMAAQVPEMILAVSSSKSFGIYRDRAGLLAFCRQGKNPAATFLQHRLRDCIRRNYFMPPDHGAALIIDILSEPKLRAIWMQEINAIRERIVGLRQMFRQSMETRIPGFDGAFFERQKGMFSCLPIDAAQQQRLEDDYAIYMLPMARLNFAALAQSQADRVADAIAEIKQTS